MTAETRKLLIATNNPGKVVELSEMLAGSPFDIASLTDFPEVIEVEETGMTFEANARLKASGYARQTGLLALADDSGLEVEALGNSPGVFSARYGGPGASFAEKMANLLIEVDEAGDATRRARFVCAMAIANNKGEVLFASEGICEGRIAPNPRGSGGFGYDPLFVPDGFDRTFGELDEAIKHKISHRARAFKQIIPFLRHLSMI